MIRRTGLVGLEVEVLKREMEPLKGSIVRNFYGLAEGTFSITFYPGLGVRRELVFSKSYVFMTGEAIPRPSLPHPFVMAVRKRLRGSKLTEISHPGMERVLRLSFSGRNGEFDLILELFGGGNLLLVDDEKRIVLALKKRVFRSRRILPGEKYKLPSNPKVELDPRNVLLDGDMEVWRFLTSFCGLGSPYIDEVAALSGVNPRELLSRLSEHQISRLSEAVSLIHKNSIEDPQPTMYLSDDGTPTDFSVIRLSTVESTNRRSYPSFISLLDDYFLDILKSEINKEERSGIERARKEIERQEKLYETYRLRAEEYRRKANTIFQNIGYVEEVLRQIRSGRSPAECLQVDYRNKVTKISIGGEIIELNFAIRASENAQRLYEVAKKLESKLKNIRVTIESLKGSIPRKKGKYLRPKAVKNWYREFRWFRSSEGFLVVIGRDKATNRTLVKKYLKEDDLFFHVDLPGGAVVLVKTEGGSPGANTIKEAAVAAASFSRAWKERLSYADVYYVTGSQVREHAPPGMYIPKGSFFIEGKRNYVKAELVLDVGVILEDEEYLLLAAPPSAAASLNFKVRVRPGEISKEEAIRRIKNHMEKEALAKGVLINISLRGLSRALPPGGFHLDLG